MLVFSDRIFLAALDNCFSSKMGLRTFNAKYKVNDANVHNNDVKECYYNQGSAYEGPLGTPHIFRKRGSSILYEVAMKLRNPLGRSRNNSEVQMEPQSPNPCSLNSSSVSVRTKKLKKKKDLKKMVLGLLYGLISGFFFSMCAASVKYLEDMDPGLVAMYQYMAIAAFSLPMAIKSQKALLGPESSTKYWLLLCGIFDAITVYLSFLSFRYLPLSDATVLTSSVPVFVTISARIFLKEKCGTSQIIAIVISVLGVTLVSKVPLLMMNRTEVYTRESVIGLLASLGSIVTESGVYVILRKLHNVDVYVILLNFGIVATIVNAMLTAIFGKYTWAVCGLQQWLIIAVGIFSFLCQLTLTKALELEEAGPVSVLMAAGDIILAFILDMTLFQDSPDGFTIGGTVLVVFSVMIVGFKTWIDEMPKSTLKKKVLKLFF